MLKRVYLKELISFDRVELELDKGLVVFSGASGAGKSILMNAILSSFGYCMAEAKLCEISIDKPLSLQSEVYDFEDEITIKSIKKDKLRYYIDNQNISKKSLNTLFKPFVRYLSIRDKISFASEELINMIDNILVIKNKDFKKLLKEYKKRYINYKTKLAQLQKIKEDESKLAQLIEFANFEIEKIEGINPKIGEDKELLKIKNQLSKIDKINEALLNANEIFNIEEAVNEVYRLLEKDNSFFIDTMNQLRADFEDIELLSEELTEIDIEYVLNRLEQISLLKTRYGSIEKALKYAEDKKEELKGYKNIEHNKSVLETFLEIELHELKALSNKITQYRKKEALSIEKKLEKYLQELKLSPIYFKFKPIFINELGGDKIEIDLNGSNASTLSGGEFNRIRLAIMVVSLSSQQKGGVIILDEIDANVSGDESIAIANMIAKLSSVYQVFAISHQAHLASKANQHILISKENGKSKAIILDKQGRVDEIARIIGGEKPNNEAVNFAIKLLD